MGGKPRTYTMPHSQLVASDAKTIPVLVILRRPNNFFDGSGVHRVLVECAEDFDDAEKQAREELDHIDDLEFETASALETCECCGGYRTKGARKGAGHLPYVDVII